MSGLTKFYYHDMQGAPELKAEWGSLLNVIRTVAIDGFNPQTPLSIDIVDGECTVTFDELEPHGFIEHQVINISGAIESEFNGEYRLTTVTSNKITFNTVFVDGTITGDVTIKTSGMGWTEKFTGENKAVFTAKNTIKNPFYLRVDNSCPVGYDTTWAKFARVTISNGINDIDNYDGFEKAPTTPNNVNINENGNGVEGVNGIFGWAKWYHGVNTYPYLKESTVVATYNNVQYEVIGDDNSIYLCIDISTAYTGRTLYAFTNFDSFGDTDKYNCFLSATSSLKRANENGEYYVSGHHASDCHWESNDIRGKFLLRNYEGANSTSHIECGVFSLNINNNVQVSGYSTNVPFPNKINNSIVISDVYMNDGTGNGIRGVLPSIKWINNRWEYNINRNIIIINDIYYIILMNNIGDSKTSYFLFELGELW